MHSTLSPGKNDANGSGVTAGRRRPIPDGSSTRLFTVPTRPPAPEPGLNVNARRRPVRFADGSRPVSPLGLDRKRSFSRMLQRERAGADFARALILGYRDQNLLADIVADDKAFDSVVTLLPAKASTVAIDLLFRRAEHLAREGRLELARRRQSRALSSEESELDFALIPGSPAKCSERSAAWTKSPP